MKFEIKDPGSAITHFIGKMCIRDRQGPIHIEIGMGKGRFLMELAAQNPQINYIGIERYSSVLLRAIQKMEEEPLQMCIRDRADILQNFFLTL